MLDFHVTLPDVQDLVFPTAELHEVPVNPFCQPVEVSLNVSE